MAKYTLRCLRRERNADSAEVLYSLGTTGRELAAAAVRRGSGGGQETLGVVRRPNERCRDLTVRQVIYLLARYLVGRSVL